MSTPLSGHGANFGPGRAVQFEVEWLRIQSDWAKWELAFRDAILEPIYLNAL